MCNVSQGILEMGRQEGRQEGRLEGRLEGRQEGRLEGKILVYYTDLNMSIEAIAEKLSIPERTVKDITTSLQQEVKS